MSKHKLLLADDSITIQKVVNLTFADEGIEVITVGDGNAAMEKFAEFSPDLVMADVYMPGLNGYEVCEKIKQNGETRHIPVILLVGSFEPYDEGEAQRVGADDHLTKPFQSIRQLVNKVNELLVRNEQSAPAEPEMPFAQEEPAPAGDSFAETLEMASPSVAADTDLGDAGMDDEMIETAHFGEFSTEEPAVDDDYGKTKPLSNDDLKEFAFVAERDDLNEMPAESIYGELESDETLDLTAGQENVEAASAPDFRPESAALDEEPVSSEEGQAFYIDTPSEASVSEKGFATVGGDFDLPDLNVQSEDRKPFEESDTETFDEPEAETAATEFAPNAEISESDEMPSAEEEFSASETVVEETAETDVDQSAETFESPTAENSNEMPMGFDDSDLLELPPLVEETGIRPLDEPKDLVSTETEPEFAPEPEPEPAESEFESAEPEEEPAEPALESVESEPALESAESVKTEETPKMTLSPELIEAIASRVAEKLSDRVIRSLTAEVVPEVTEQILREITEENLKK